MDLGLSTLKTKIVRIEAEGRDKGKTFVITEFPAKRAERWAERAWLGLTQNGVSFPEGLEEAGLAGLVAAGLSIFGRMPFEVLDLLMEEMFQAVSIMPDPAHPERIRPLIDRGAAGDDIQELKTRLTLRSEIIELHVGFSPADALSKYRASAAETAAETSSATRTSRVASAR